MNKQQFLTAVTALVERLIPLIHDDYRASEDPDDKVPGMQLTIGADSEGWSYQTGDNSCTGGAYGYATWGVGYIYRDSVPAEVAHDIMCDLEDNESDGADEVPIFDPETAAFEVDGESSGFHDGAG